MSPRMPSLTRCCRHRLRHIWPFFTFSVIVGVFDGASKLEAEIDGDGAKDRNSCTGTTTSSRVLVLGRSPTIPRGAWRHLGSDQFLKGINCKVPRPVLGD